MKALLLEPGELNIQYHLNRVSVITDKFESELLNKSVTPFVHI